jgi:hypothetical protein
VKLLLDEQFSYLIADALRVLVNLGLEGVLELGHIAGVVQQRQVDVGLHIALRARIAVPVPGAADIRARFDRTDPQTLATQTVQQIQTGEPCADNQCINGCRGCQ